MPSTADLALWLMTTVVELFVVCFTIVQRQFRKFPFLNLYLMASIATNIGRYVIFNNLGVGSSDYAHFYYSSDALLSLFLFLSICELTVRMVGMEMPSWKLLLSCAGFFALMAALSFSEGSSAGMFSVLSFLEASYGRMFFMNQLSQNVFDACYLAMALIFFWTLNNRPADRIAGRLVTVLCVYFCLTFLIGRARQYLPRSSDAETLYAMAAMAGAWLPLGCGFALASNQQPGTKDV